MAKWNYQDFVQNYKRSPLSVLYYFYGEEEYLKERSLQDLKKYILQDSLEDFNLNLFYAGEANIQQILDAAETLPMMNAKRLVVVKRAENLKAKELEELQNYLLKPVDTTCFVLLGKNIDKRKKIFKLIEKEACLVHFESLKHRELIQWIHQLAAEENKKMAGDSADCLFQLVGSHLNDISVELKKLTYFVGSRDTIFKEDVLSVVTRLRIESVFALARAIGEQDRGKALFYLANLLSHGENEIGVLALIARHIRILSMVKEGLREGLAQNQLAARVGVPPFYLKEYHTQSNSWSKDKLNEVHKALLLTDKALKASPISSHIWLENFVIKTCSL